jgi:cell division protein FtsZ
MQGTLALDTYQRGRFDKSEPTIVEGEDLDIPTFLRKGIKLNPPTRK